MFHRYFPLIFSLYFLPILFLVSSTPASAVFCHTYYSAKAIRNPINIGRVTIVILASITTWFLTGNIVYELNLMDLAAVEWVRPMVEVQSENAWSLEKLLCTATEK